jgi:pimeloyl-ACP methyl ester carboxylesterase
MALLRSLLKWLAFLLGGVTAALALLGALPQPPTPPAPAGDRQLEVDGTTIRYRQAGAGADVLLAHGSPGSVEDWEAVWEGLTARYRVTAYDRPGHGYSGSGGRRHSLADNARVAHGLVAALGLRGVVFVGHSYGGATALRLAVDDPPEIAAYVLVGARAYGRINVDPIYRLVSLPWLGVGFARASAALIAPGVIRSGIAESIAPNAAMLPAGFVEQRVALWSQPKVAVAAALERAGFERGLAELAARYHAIARPVFIVVGDKDEVPLAAAGRLARDIPGARLTVLPETGHYVQYARPAELVQVVAEAAAGAATQGRR